MTSPQSRSIQTIRLIGGRLCLDFVNTAVFGDPARRDRQDIAGGRVTPHVSWEFIRQHDDLTAWGARTGLLEAAELRALESFARQSPGIADRIGRQARELRQDLRIMLSPGPAKADAGTDEPSAAVLALLQRSLAQVDLVRAGSGFRLSATGPAAGAWLFAPVALSAVELLSSPDLARVKQCPGDRCRWLFLDISRNSTRRWCSMASCGNRAKAQRHYRELRGAARGSAGASSAGQEAAPEAGPDSAKSRP